MSVTSLLVWTRFLRISPLVFACLLASLQGRDLERKLERLLPADTFFYVKAEAFGKGVETLEKSPLGELVGDESLEEFFAPLYETFDLSDIAEALGKEDSEFGWEQLSKMFPGQFIFGLTMPENFEEGDPDFLLMAEYAGSDKDLEELLEIISDEKNPPEGAKVNSFTETWLGETMHIEEVEGEDIEYYINGWAMVDDVFIIGQPVERLQEAITILKEGEETNTLAGDPRFDEAYHFSEGADYSMAIAVGNVMDKIVEAAQAEHEAGGQAAPFTPEVLFEALGFQSMDFLVANMRQKEDELHMDIALFHEERKGLLTLLEYGQGPMPTPGFVPRDVASTSVGRYSLGKAWENVVDMVNGLNPMFGGMMQGYFDGLKAETGLDFQERVINNMGEVFVTMANPSAKELAVDTEGDPIPVYDQVIAFQLLDPRALSEYIDAVVGLLVPNYPLFEKRDYMGVTLNTLNTQGAAPGMQSITYAITDEYFMLCLGETEILEEAISAQSRDEGGFWEEKAVADAFADLPEGASQFAHTDMASMTTYILRMLATVQEQATAAGDDLVICDPSALPDKLSFDYYMLSTAYSQEDAFIIRYFLKPGKVLP